MVLTCCKVASCVMEYREVVFDWVQGGMMFDYQKETVILDWVEGFVALAWMLGDVTLFDDGHKEMCREPCRKPG